MGLTMLVLTVHVPFFVICGLTVKSSKLQLEKCCQRNGSYAVGSSNSLHPLLPGSGIEPVSLSRLTLALLYCCSLYISRNLPALILYITIRLTLYFEYSKSVIGPKEWHGVLPGYSLV